MVLGIKLGASKNYLEQLFSVEILFDFEVFFLKIWFLWITVLMLSVTF